MDGRVGAVPQWLNEGLAMELSASKIPEIRQLARGPVRLIALNDLEGTWSRLPADAALVAYVEGKSATRYMIERYGMDRVQHVLSALAAGQSSAEAFETGLLITYPDFQRRWVEDLNSRISTGSS
jgi:hypothetical protein